MFELAKNLSTIEISDRNVRTLLALPESHFLDFKSKDIAPAKLSESISAFGNSDGGEIYVGIKESDVCEWDGFANVEALNDYFHLIYDHFKAEPSIIVDILSNKNQLGLVLKIEITKTSNIFHATSGKIYLRVNASKLPVNSPDKLRQLEFEKGLSSYEDNTTHDELIEICNSKVIIEFMLNVVPTGEPENWLRKEK